MERRYVAQEQVFELKMTFFQSFDGLHLSLEHLLRLDVPPYHVGNISDRIHQLRHVGLNIVFVLFWNCPTWLLCGVGCSFVGSAQLLSPCRAEYERSSLTLSLLRPERDHLVPTRYQSA